MRVLLDLSPHQILQKSAMYGQEFWQLRTPLTRHTLTDLPYGLDNGCFTTFERTTWQRMLREAHACMPIFVCLPDVVADARRTLELWEHFQRFTQGLPRALVLQDGIGDFSIPWEQLSAVFVGGTDQFKSSPEALNAVRTARILGKWVHVGRVNTPSRARIWMKLADSIDGSGISRFDHMLEDLLSVLGGNDPQLRLVV